MKILLIDFSKNLELENILRKNHEVFTERTDGARAYQIAGTLSPALIIINHSNKPSHGWKTAEAIKKRKKTGEIPIYFFNENESEHKKVYSTGKFVTLNELKNII